MTFMETAPSPRVTNACPTCGGGEQGFMKRDGPNGHATWCEDIILAPSDPRRTRARIMFSQGVPAQDIAIQLGTNDRTVYRWCEGIDRTRAAPRP